MNNLSNNKFNFEDLFIFEMANNHQGSVEHGLSIISAMGDIVRRTGVKAAVKFQFRDLDSLIHPSYLNYTDNKHIKRFISTRLDKNAFKLLAEEVKNRGMLAISTPFDEASVDLIEDLGIDVVKIASSSANDWPLL